jgi:hypothetical protein
MSTTVRRDSAGVTPRRLLHCVGATLHTGRVRAVEARVSGRRSAGALLLPVLLLRNLLPLRVAAPHRTNRRARTGADRGSLAGISRDGSASFSCSSADCPFCG